MLQFRVLYLYIYMLVKRETSNINIKSLLATNGNTFVNDFRKTKRLMKGMTFSVLGCWLIVVGHTFRPG